MVELTRFTKKDFQKLLSKYDIGGYKSHKHVPYALGNTVYVLWTTRGKFIVKVPDKHNLHVLRRQLSTIRYLAKKRVPVQNIIFSKNNQEIILFKNRSTTILKFVYGKHPRRLTRELTINLARNIALLHEKLRGVKPTGNKESMLKEHLGKTPRIKHPYIKQKYGELSQLSKTMFYSKLKKRMIHGDLDEINIIVRQNKVKAFLDWEDVHRDYLVQDMGVFISNTFFTDKDIKKDKLKLFMKHYTKYIKLNQEEKKAILLFMKMRVIHAILWCEGHLATHKDFRKEIKKRISYLIRQYKIIDAFSQKEFLKLL